MATSWNCTHERPQDTEARTVTIPVWFKLAYTVFVIYIMAVWWTYYGWKNFLWFSDIAFIGAVPAMWLENAALASVLTVAVLLPEMLWNVDYGLRLLLRRRITGLTDYMFEPDRLLLLRGLSLFHVPLPLVLLWMIAAYGYDASVGLTGAIALGAVVLPWSRIVSTSEKNINWTYGFGARRVRWPGWVYVPVLFVGFVLFVFIPTDWLMRRWFGD
jgi:hypothetical protein